MAEFVVGVVRDVLRHVLVQLPERVRIRGISDRKFSVLLPQVRLQQLRRREELQNGNVTSGQRIVIMLRFWRSDFG